MKSVADACEGFRGEREGGANDKSGARASCKNIWFSGEPRWEFR